VGCKNLQTQQATFTMPFPGSSFQRHPISQGLPSYAKSPFPQSQTSFTYDSAADVRQTPSQKLLIDSEKQNGINSLFLILRIDTLAVSAILNQDHQLFVDPGMHPTKAASIL